MSHSLLLIIQEHHIDGPGLNLHSDLLSLLLDPRNLCVEVMHLLGQRCQLVREALVPWVQYGGLEQEG
jgi:hypothetical protein